MLGKLLVPFQGKKCFYKIWNKLYLISLSGMNVGGGGAVDSSGEINVLKYIGDVHSDNNLIRIFDCGANKGQYAQCCLHFFAKFHQPVEIHCFEPGHTTYKYLQENIGGEKHIILNNYGLGDTDSQQELYYDEPGSGIASIYKRQLDYFNIDFDKSEIITLTTLDKYVEDKFAGEDNYIDLLKIDVEGNELNVLQGAKNTLLSDKVKTIQIEFGGCNIDSRTFIRDFWNLLHEKYHMYRILKDGFVEIERYQETIENFSCMNLFFVHR